jgi:putative flippase GtrA
VNVAIPALYPPRRATIVRALRCLSVSVGTTALSAGILVLLTLGVGVPAGTANVIAVLCGIGPSYIGNRRWVWARDGRGDVAREVVPFWAMSVLGLVLSTVAVARIAHVATAWSTTDRAVALPAANLTVFAALWLAQFFVLDRVIFRDRASHLVERGSGRADVEKDRI